MNSIDTAFIVQARLGSTRMPAKILKPFHGDETILDIIISKLKATGIRVIIATTIHPNDLPLVEKGHSLGVDVFQGSEEDVLQRFIDAAQTFNIKKIIRVCSDNPFLDFESLYSLISAIETSEMDYVSFSINGIPSIKTHFGFWTEYVTLDALKKVRNLTNDTLYHEHVTNYIYSHPESFKIDWIQGPMCIENRNDIRLTIDTPEDFNRTAQLYTELRNNNLSIDKIVSYLDDNPEYLERMRRSIKANTK